MSESADTSNASGAVDTNGNRTRQSGRTSNNNNNRMRPKAAHPDPEMKGYFFNVVSTTYGKVQFRKCLDQLTGYVSRKFTVFTPELTNAVRNLELVMPNAPADPPANDPVVFEVWKEDRKKFVKKEDAYNDFKGVLYTIVWNTCSIAMQEKARANADFDAAMNDGIALLIIIRRAVYSFDQGKKKEECFLETLRELMNLSRGNMTLAEFNDEFDSIEKVLEEEGWSIIPNSLLEQVADDNGRAGNPNVEDHAEMRQRVMSVLFLQNAKKGQQGKVAGQYHQHLKTLFIDNNDAYPTTVAQAFGNVQMHETRDAEDGGFTNPRRRDRHRGGASGRSDGRSVDAGVTYVTVAGRDGVTHANIRCYNCNGFGHFVDQCPENGGNGNNGEIGHVCVHVYGKMPSSWVLLDSQANVDVFHTKSLLTNIRKVSEKKYIQGHGGMRWTQMKGDLPGYGPPRRDQSTAKPP